MTNEMRCLNTIKDACDHPFRYVRYKTLKFGPGASRVQLSTALGERASWLPDYE